MPKTRSISALGRLNQVKEQHPEKIVGVLGCMAQKDQGQIFSRAPHVDLVVGPGQLARLPALLAEVAADRQPRLEVSLDRRGSTARPWPRVSRSSIRRAIAAGPARCGIRPWCGSCWAATSSAPTASCRGCGVPSRAGRPPTIEAEVRRLADDGCREVTLLGQTVNSYQDASDGRTLRLADLLDRLHDIAGPAAPEVRHQLSRAT